MRTIGELLDNNDPAWPVVQQWLADALTTVRVLPADPIRAKEVLLSLQVTTRSPMGAVAFQTGGLLFDHSWLRFLGSGSAQIGGDLTSWNSWLDNGNQIGGHSRQGIGATGLPHALLVAYDAVGGFFAINGGAFAGEPGTAFYFAPDTLAWEELGLSYSQLLQWAAKGDLAAFYKGMRWPGWEAEVEALTESQVFSCYPPLWANAELPISERSRRPVSALEAWELQQDILAQLREAPPAEHD